MSSKAHKWRRTFDELWGNSTMTARKESMTGTQASAISGGVSGLLLTFALGMFILFKYWFLTLQFIFADLKFLVCVVVQLIFLGLKFFKPV